MKKCRCSSDFTVKSHGSFMKNDDFPVPPAGSLGPTAPATGLISASTARMVASSRSRGTFTCGSHSPRCDSGWVRDLMGISPRIWDVKKTVDGCEIHQLKTLIYHDLSWFIP